MRNGAAMKGSFTLQHIDIGKRGFDKLRARAFPVAFTRLEDHTFLPVRKAVVLQKIPLNHSNGLQMEERQTTKGAIEAKKSAFNLFFFSFFLQKSPFFTYPAPSNQNMQT